MDLIDEDGRLFGLVNVIDALVVLLVLAVVVAGFALLDPFAPPATEETRYATIDLGGQPQYVAEQITAGDLLRPDGAMGNVTVTDVYVGPQTGANVSVTVRAQINGTLKENGAGGPSFVYAGDSVTQGTDFTLDTDEYVAEGTITRLARSGEDLETSTERVRVESDVSPSVAQQVSSGDTFDLANRTVGTIEDVHIGPGSDTSARHVTASLSVDAIRRPDGLAFGDRSLSLGEQISFRTATYTLNGSIDTLDGTAIESGTMEVAVESTVSTTVANEIQVGDTYDVSGRTAATVQSIDVYPTGDDTTRRVLLGLDVQTVEREAGPYFGANRVALGTTLLFETDAYSFAGTIIGQGSYTPAGETETLRISVKVKNVTPEFADGIAEGMTETNVERTTARIVEKRAEAASKILTSEDGEIFERTHPRNKDVYLTVDATVRETTGGYQFHARSLKEGNTITLDFRSITVRGTVTDIRTD